MLNLTGTAMIRLNPNGFSMVDRNSVHDLAWDSVKEIFAFKLDFGMWDTIRLGFRVSGNGTYFQVDEDDSGYSELVTEIERRFPIEKGWWSKVAFPAFATNRTTLWGEPSEW